MRNFERKKNSAIDTKSPRETLFLREFTKALRLNQQKGSTVWISSASQLLRLMAMSLFKNLFIPVFTAHYD